MAVITLFIGAVLAQAVPLGAPASVVVAGRGSGDYVEVAHDELMQRQAQAAIARINANDEVERNDPARLINLGTAYAMLGRVAEARASYHAARASDEHYYLELADGSWMDSRRAARLATEKLAQREVLALR